MINIGFPRTSHGKYIDKQ